MTEEQKQAEVIAFMLDSINKDNRELSAQAGMDAETIERSIEQSQLSLGLLLSNLYTRMNEARLLA